jgi:hypothetical protein
VRPFPDSSIATPTTSTKSTSILAKQTVKKISRKAVTPQLDEEEEEDIIIEDEESCKRNIYLIIRMPSLFDHLSTKK